MRLIFTTILLILILVNIYPQSQNPHCRITNSTFLPDEETMYIVSYNWFVIFSEVGTVKFKLSSDRIFGQDALHYWAEGRSYNWWDRFFKVRDRYEVWVNEDNLRPLFFQRNNREGNFRQHESYTFKGDSLIYRKNKVNDRPLGYDTLRITPCTWDVMSALLYTRNFDYSNRKIGEKIPITVALDEESYDLYFRYQGIEDIKLKDMGTFECMKFTVLLVEGTMFHEGEDMKLWVTNDLNRIPVYVESPILVGSIKARIIDIKGNRFPLTSRKE